MNIDDSQLPRLSSADITGLLFLHNPQPMWIYKKDTLRFLAVNEAALRRYGYTREQFLCMSLADIRPREDVALLRQSLVQTSDDPCTRSVWRHRDSRNNLFWAEATSQHIFFDNEKAHLVTIGDITERKSIEKDLDRERSLIEAIVETAGTLIVVMDCSGRIIRFNRACEELTGYSAAEVMGQHFWKLFLRPQDIDSVCAVLADIIGGQFPNSHENHWLTRDGRKRLIAWKNTALLDQEGKAEFVIATGTDITEQRQAEEALLRTQKQYRSIFENAVEGIFQTTPTGGYISANPALARIYKYDSPEDLISHIDDIAAGLYVDPTRRDAFTSEMQKNGVIVNFESQVRCKEGSIIWISESARSVRDSSGEILYYEGMVEEITERKALEAEREHLLTEAVRRADYDALTGLLNHRTFHIHFEEALAAARRAGSSCAVALLDLDSFGFFNDTYGHAVGDDLLRRIASLLKESGSPGEIIGRFAGDEYALLMPGATSGKAAARLSECLAHISGWNYRPSGHDCVIPLNLSVGLALFPEDGLTRQDLLNMADGRLKRAKSGGDSYAPVAELRRTLTQTMQGFSMLDALVTSVDTKDRYTRRHSEDVLTHCLTIARQQQLGEEFIKRIQTAALLHDVGKIGIPDYILRKPGRLTEEEYTAIQHHPMMGAVIVGAVPGFEETLDAIRHHHERWDGNGYPFGLEGAAIPLMARLMAVADAYSAMTMDRPYRRGMDPEKALQILEQGSGTQWDPDFVAAFLQAHPLKKRTQTRRAA